MRFTSARGGPRGSVQRHRSFNAPHCQMPLAKPRRQLRRGAQQIDETLDCNFHRLSVSCSDCTIIVSYFDHKTLNVVKQNCLLLVALLMAACVAVLADELGRDKGSNRFSGFSSWPYRIFRLAQRGRTWFRYAY